MQTQTCIYKNNPKVQAQTCKHKNNLKKQDQTFKHKNGLPRNVDPIQKRKQKYNPKIQV